MVPSPINPTSQFITACSQADLHYPKCSSTVFSIPVQACFKDLCLEVNIRELNREKGLLWKWRLRSKEVQSLPCDLYRKKIAIFILLPFHVLPSFFGPTCPRCVWGTSWMLMNFTACYLWHKNKCCPFTGRSVELPELELKLKKVELHQWEQQSNSAPQTCWDIPLHHVRTWKSFSL